MTYKDESPTGTEIVKGGVYTAELVGIDKMTTAMKDSVHFDSYLWRWRIIGGKHDGRYSRGLTPRRMVRSRKGSNISRLVEWLDVLKGEAIKPEVVSKYSKIDVGVEVLREKYVGQVCKIRITRHKHSTGGVDYRVTSIVEVVV